MALGLCQCGLPQVCSGSLQMELQEPAPMRFPWEGRGMTLFWL